MKITRTEKPDKTIGCGTWLVPQQWRQPSPPNPTQGQRAEAKHHLRLVPSGRAQWLHASWYKNVQRVCVCLLLLSVLCSCTLFPDNTAKNSSSSSNNGSSSKNNGTQPLALVYRGPAACDGCPEAAAALLQSSQWGFDVQYVGPQESLSIADGLKLPNAKVYVQSGGNDDVDQTYTLLQADAPAIQNFIQSGGRYLGLCMGGYLAGNPGFNLLANDGGAGDTDEYIGSDAKTPNETVLQIQWQGNLRSIYFQDGPYFNVSPQKVTTLATYSNGQIAMMVAPYGQGKVGLSGPHPEAQSSWYTDIGFPPENTVDLGHNLIDALMQ